MQFLKVHFSGKMVATDLMLLELVTDIIQLEILFLIVLLKWPLN